MLEQQPTPNRTGTGARTKPVANKTDTGITTPPPPSNRYMPKNKNLSLQKEIQEQEPNLPQQNRYQHKNQTCSNRTDAGATINPTHPPNKIDIEVGTKYPPSPQQNRYGSNNLKDKNKCKGRTGQKTVLCIMLKCSEQV